MIAFDLPFPPSVNHYWRWVGPHRVIVSPVGRAYRKAVIDAIRQAKALGGALSGHGLPLAGRLALSLTLTPPDNRRRDLDNHIKAVQDALTHAGLWGDDEQIDYLVVQRATPLQKQSGVHVTIAAACGIAGVVEAETLLRTTKTRRSGFLRFNPVVETGLKHP